MSNTEEIICPRCGNSNIHKIKNRFQDPDNWGRVSVLICDICGQEGLKEMWKLVTEYFNLAKKVKKLRDEREAYEDFFHNYDCLKAQRDKYAKLCESYSENGRICTKRILVQANYIKELERELEEYKNKYALLRASVLGIKEEPKCQNQEP